MLFTVGKFNKLTLAMLKKEDQPGGPVIIHFAVKNGVPPQRRTNKIYY